MYPANVAPPRENDGCGVDGENTDSCRYRPPVDSAPLPGRGQTEARECQGNDSGRGELSRGASHGREARHNDDHREAQRRKDCPWQPDTGQRLDEKPTANRKRCEHQREHQPAGRHRHRALHIPFGGELNAVVEWGLAEITKWWNLAGGDVRARRPSSPDWLDLSREGDRPRTPRRRIVDLDLVVHISVGDVNALRILGVD